MKEENQIAMTKQKITEIKCSYGFDPSPARDVGALFLFEASKTLTNGSSPGHHAAVLIVYGKEESDNADREEIL